MIKQNNFQQIFWGYSLAYARYANPLIRTSDELWLE